MVLLSNWFLRNTSRYVVEFDESSTEYCDFTHVSEEVTIKNSWTKFNKLNLKLTNKYNMKLKTCHIKLRSGRVNRRIQTRSRTAYTSEHKSGICATFPAIDVAPKSCRRHHQMATLVSSLTPNSYQL